MSLFAAREYKFPRELVFRAWTTPDLLAQWWGPQGFTNTIHECEMKPGGTWLFTMHGPDGVEYPNHNLFVEIAPPERIVIDHLSGQEFRVTATFESFEDRTRSPFVNFSRKKRSLN
ncbi:SRPBCC domain-containing protein [Tumebacillus flagellatus]|uniref:SRPBCC domain-containing protein n=1 Tax=Tumebacillus flagellatus TaxID=1157490 RepID=UPI001EE63A17|nr:SRPBCC domain-containing protein [Tumebacillus flagellatus]